MPPNESTSLRSFDWRHAAFFLFGILAVLLAQFLSPKLVRGSYPHASAVRDLSGLSVPPWGRLHYTTIELERPDESLPMPPPAPEPIRWIFTGLSRQELSALFSQSGLAEEETLRVLSPPFARPLTNGWEVSPPVEFVRDLNQAARKSIYTVLQKNRLNPFHQAPFRIAAEKFEPWLAKSGLSPEKQALIRKLAFVEGETIDFYDGPLLDWICSPEERRLLAKAVSRVDALLMQLQVSRDTDVAALMKYWGQGGRGHAIEPFLGSLTRVPEGATVSVSFFFPPIPQMRLYTYPDQVYTFEDRGNTGGTIQEDCFWTAMNFFNEKPDHRFFDPAFTKQTLQTAYTVVRTNWVFGDLLLLVDEHDEAMHMCVYVADDVVFTKNGSALLRPWVLMRRSDMLAEYAQGKLIRCVGFRRRQT